MADEFDPLKDTGSETVESLHARIQKSPVKTQDDNLLPPQYENILKTSSNQEDSSTGQNSQHDAYQKLNFIQNAPKMPVRSTNPFDDDVKKASIPTEVSYQPPPEIKKGIVSEERQASVNEEWKEPAQQTSASVHNRSYEAGSIPTTYYQDDYYYHESAYKRRGLSATLSRLVQRFPILSLFYQPSEPTAPEVYETEQEVEYTEEIEAETEEVPQLVDENQLQRELTTDELALDQRYSNKLRTQIIGLPTKDQAQPIGVCIHHETYTIYSCDVARSVVEIFDMYGKLLHTISDQTTIKFQPTAIAVTYDGTIITASHFSHRLLMHSPIESAQNGNQNARLSHEYQYRQYKLGSPGHEIHQFHHPAGIAIDHSDGYLYVCDRGNFRIQVMRPEGVCDRVIDLILADESDSQIAPVQIAHQQNLEQIVCLVDKCDALCFIPRNANGSTVVEPFYVLDPDGLGLLGASGLAIDHEDRIFISDTGHHRIVICTPDGNYLTHFGVEGSGPGELNRPCGLAITKDGTLVVADSGNKRFQLFGSMREQTTDNNEAETNKYEEKIANLIDTDQL